MSADALALEFTDPSGEALRFEWPAGALAALDQADPDQKPIWRLGGELDWDQVESVRIVSARLDDGRLISVAALRPAGASGHGEELVAGALGTAAAFEQLQEALLSTEYGPDALPRRIGLELYRSDGGLPLRIAGDATATTIDEHRGVRRVSAALELRMSGCPGFGLLDVLSRR